MVVDTRVVILLSFSQKGWELHEKILKAWQVILHIAQGGHYNCTSFKVLKAALGGVLSNLMNLQKWAWFEQGIRPDGLQRVLANEITVWLMAVSTAGYIHSFFFRHHSVQNTEVAGASCIIPTWCFWCGPAEGKITENIQKVTKLLQPYKKWNWIACEANKGINLEPVWDQYSWVLTLLDL